MKKATVGVGLAAVLFVLFLGSFLGAKWGVFSPRPARATSTNDLFHFVQFNGNLCEMSAFGASQSVHHSAYGVYNDSSTADAIVDCPLPMDSAWQDDKQIYLAQMVVYDRNSTRDITCSLQYSSTGGLSTLPGFGLSSTGGGPGTGAQGLSTPNNLNQRINAPLFYECVIPRAESGAVSHIQSYSLSWVQN